MNIYNLSSNNSLLNNFIREIRDTDIQKDSMRFRRNIERIGEIMAYEISKTLDFSTIDVQTPLGIAPTNIVSDKIVVASILRAGLTMHNGMLSYFDSAENCFVSAYRKYIDETNFNVHVEYIASPDLTGKTVILCDPMLATGKSMELAYQAILTRGTPRRLIIASVIASKKAIEVLKESLPNNIDIYVAVVDPELNDHAYIVPGIGDCGDLAYGVKMD